MDAVPADAGPVPSLLDDAVRLLLEQLTRWRDLPPLGAVTAARELSAAVTELLRATVDRARDAGHSWAELGDVLGTSRQAAFQRFGRPVDPRTGKPMAQTLLPGAAEHAVALFVDLVEGRWDQVRRDFDERMLTSLPAAHIASVWAQAASMVGQYESMGEPFARAAGDYTTVNVPLQCEAGQLTGQVTYDRHGKVAGLFIRPGTG